MSLWLLTLARKAKLLSAENTTSESNSGILKPEVTSLPCPSRFDQKTWDAIVGARKARKEAKKAKKMKQPQNSLFLPSSTPYVKPPEVLGYPHLWGQQSSGVHNSYPFTKQECHHWQQAVTVGSHTVWCSASSDKETEREIPDLTVGLAKMSWETIVDPVFTTSGPVSFYQEGPPAIFVDWPDYGAVSLKDFQRIINYIVRYLKADKTVEFGCMGGHGRTGTLLAGLFATVEKLPALESIKKVHDTYCKHAIESASQEDLIYALTGETPPKPVIVPGKFVSKMTPEAVFERFTTETLMFKMKQRNLSPDIDDVIAFLQNTCTIHTPRKMGLCSCTFTVLADKLQVSLGGK